MCRFSDSVTHPVTPDWITQTRDEVADAELDAAAIHYTWMELISDGQISVAEQKIGGDYQHHEYWWKKHTEAAWFVSQDYTEKRIGK